MIYKKEIYFNILALRHLIFEVSIGVKNATLT